MSFPCRKRPFYPSLAVLLIISLLHICLSSRAMVDAIRILPRRLSAAAEDGVEAAPPPPPGRNQTEIFKEYFSTLNATANGSYGDDKRRIPSCPDPLHN